MCRQFDTGVRWHEELLREGRVLGAMGRLPTEINSFRRQSEFIPSSKRIRFDSLAFGNNIRTPGHRLVPQVTRCKNGCSAIHGPKAKKRVVWNLLRRARQIYEQIAEHLRRRADNWLGGYHVENTGQFCTGTNSKIQLCFGNYRELDEIRQAKEMI